MAAPIPPDEKTPLLGDPEEKKAANSASPSKKQQGEDNSTCRPKTQEKKTHCCYKFWVVIVCILCIVSQLIEAGFVLCKRAHPAIACIHCKNGTSIAVQQSLDVEYVFYYLVGYGFITFLRILWFILLGIGLWRLANGLDDKIKKAFKVTNMITKLFCTCACKRIVLRGVLLLIMFLTALAYFVLGIEVEIEYSKTVPCVHYSDTLYVVSCCLNFLTHTFYIIILVMMMGASEAMERMLFPLESTSADMDKPDVEKGTPVKPETSIEQRYKEDGKRIRLINQVFQAWYILPMVILLIEIRMPAARNRFRPWVVNDEPPLLVASYEIVHFFYQILFAIILIDNGYRLAAISRRYFRELREREPLLQEDDQNTFTPTIGNTTIPLSTVVSIFFTLFGLMVILGDDFLAHVQP